MNRNMHVIQARFRQRLDIFGIEIVTIRVDDDPRLGQRFPRFSNAIKNRAIRKRFIVAIHDKILGKIDLG